MFVKNYGDELQIQDSIVHIIVSHIKYGLKRT